VISQALVASSRKRFTGAVAAHDKALGRDHAWTKESARVTADALDALGRTEDAKALREQYGVASSDDPKPS
jgi:hypothetical protein